MNTIKHTRLIFKAFAGLLIVYFLVNFVGCSGCPYSFTGSSVPPHLRTLAIPFAEDRSGSGNPDLRELLTTKITQKFMDDNSFRLTDRTQADAVLEMYVVSVEDVIGVVAAGENIQTRRINISVQVAYRDLVKKVVVFDKRFTDYGDYPAGGGLDAIKQAINAAFDKITDSILLDTVSGW